MNSSTQNYFELFSLAEAFQVDINALDQAYKKLQIQYHPDKYVNEDESAKLFALQTTSIINEAYSCLKSPLKRAAYLLTLHGVDPEENNQSHLGGEFLFKQIELREKLDEIAASEAIETLDSLKADIEKEKQTYLTQFEKYYQNAAYKEAKPIYSKLQFFYKLLTEIDSVEEKILGY